MGFTKFSGCSIFCALPRSRPRRFFRLSHFFEAFRFHGLPRYRRLPCIQIFLCCIHIVCSRHRRRLCGCAHPLMPALRAKFRLSNVDPALYFSYIFRFSSLFLTNVFSAFPLRPLAAGTRSGRTLPFSLSIRSFSGNQIINPDMVREKQRGGAPKHSCRPYHPPAPFYTLSRRFCA